MTLRNQAWLWIAAMAFAAAAGCSPSPSQTTAGSEQAGTMGATGLGAMGQAAISDTFPKRDTLPIPSPSDTLPRPR